MSDMLVRPVNGEAFPVPKSEINPLLDAINKQNRRIDSLEREIERLRRDLQQIRSSQIL